MLDGALWLAQFLMFVAFAVAAWMKTMTPISKLAATWPWTGQLPRPVVRGLGLIDLLGGAGVFLPALLGILPQLTVPAALGCVALQLSALAFHISRREIKATPANIVFLATASFISWGRWHP